MRFSIHRALAPRFHAGGDARGRWHRGGYSRHPAPLGLCGTACPWQQPVAPRARGDGNPPCRMNRARPPVRRSSAIPPSGRRGRRPYAHDQARWSGSSRNPGCAARALPLAACRRRRDGLPSSEAKRRSLHPALRDARAPGSIALPSGEAIVIAAVQGMPQFGSAPSPPGSAGRRARCPEPGRNGGGAGMTKRVTRTRRIPFPIEPECAALFVCFPWSSSRQVNLPVLRSRQ